MRELSSRLIEMLNARRLRLQQQHYQLQQQHNDRVSVMRRGNTSIGLSQREPTLGNTPVPLPPPPLPDTPPPAVQAANERAPATSTPHLNQTQRLSFVKKRERNFLAAFCSIFCIAVLTVSLAETRWFFLNGGGCNVNYLGVSYFFVPGLMESRVEASKVSKFDINVYNFILPNGFTLRNCANFDILLIMRLMIAFIFMAIVSSLIGLMIDSFGFMRTTVKLIRRHAIFHIITTILCLIINGFCFWVSERIYDQQYLTRFKKGKRVDVQFDVSYYLIVLASGLSILATAFTLVRRYPTDEDEQLDRILEEYTGFEDPMSLERSLPASAQTAESTVNTQNLSAGVCVPRFAAASSREVVPLLPPATPPPSIRSINNFDDVPSTCASHMNEPPPPYLDDDTVPLIV